MGGSGKGAAFLKKTFQRPGDDFQGQAQAEEGVEKPVPRALGVLVQDIIFHDVPGPGIGLPVVAVAIDEDHVRIVRNAPGRIFADLYGGVIRSPRRR